MKKKNVLMALSVVALIGLASCKKESKLVPTPGAAQTATDQTLRRPTYDAGIRAIKNFPANQETNVDYYRIYFNTALGLQTPYYYNYFGGDMTSTLKGYGYAVSPTTGGIAQAYAYTISGLPILDYNGGIVVIMSNPSTVFAPVIEEIEIDPSTLKVFAIARLGNTLRLYQIDESTGIATLWMNGASANLFSNPTINGYKSGSIAFIPDASVPGTYRLVFANESTIYASSGVGFWVYTLDYSLSKITNQAAANRTCNISPLPFTTDKINSTYGDGKYYFGRDGGDLYSINLSVASNTPGCVVQENSGTFGLSYDYGYWKNF